MDKVPTLDNPPPRRLSHDEKLRGAGFVILTRPRKGETTWKRNNRVYTEREAETLVRINA